MIPEETAVQVVVKHITQEYPRYETIRIEGSTKKPGVTCTICPEDPEWTEKRMKFVIQEAAKLKKMHEELV
ncbi:hypothetical protein [Methanorbis furvi]|uniref:Uncharacterized protein n=1 Tax=Methanorbis furvi TaxID=3028299 RepID=A0AAE4MEM6_9EURY|nr:hypothetical protein [Methanocorpusculaceae archaeon Ag1]